MSDDDLTDEEVKELNRPTTEVFHPTPAEWIMRKHTAQPEPVKVTRGQIEDTIYHNSPKLLPSDVRYVVDAILAAFNVTRKQP